MSSIYFYKRLIRVMLTWYMRIHLISDYPLRTVVSLLDCELKMHKQGDLTLPDEEHYAGPKYYTRDGTHDNEMWSNDCQSLSKNVKGHRVHKLGSS
jgi:hypothetical protein